LRGDQGRADLGRDSRDRTQREADGPTEQTQQYLDCIHFRQPQPQGGVAKFTLWEGTSRHLAAQGSRTLGLGREVPSRSMNLATPP
jgi:hypothetical protein